MTACVFLLVLGNLFSGSLSDPEGKVVIVCFLEGKSWISESGEKERSEINLFDWIKTGAIIETDSEARVILTFSTGDRYELKGKTKATVGQKGFLSHTGSLKKLSSVAVMPQIASISKEARPGSRLGGFKQ